MYYSVLLKKIPPFRRFDDFMSQEERLRCCRARLDEEGRYDSKEGCGESAGISQIQGEAADGAIVSRLVFDQPVLVVCARQHGE